MLGELLGVTLGTTQASTRTGTGSPLGARTVLSRTLGQDWEFNTGGVAGSALGMAGRTAGRALSTVGGPQVFLGDMVHHWDALGHHWDNLGSVPRMPGDLLSLSAQHFFGGSLRTTGDALGGRSGLTLGLALRATCTGR
jgi:hypothetical protein